MLISRVIVSLPRGLQSAKNTVDFVTIASSFASEITITYKDVTSRMEIMEIMDLNVKKGQEITIIAKGTDEQKALYFLKGFLLGDKGLGDNYKKFNAC
ncbi:HPr family phosphocarrier protein [Paenibacillus alvei]